MNYSKRLLISALFVLFTNLFTVNLFAADYVSDGFEIDKELLKCAIDSNEPLSIDKDNDYIVTLQEWSSQADLLLDCENYNITDWSALKEIKFMTQLTIKNADSADLSVLCENQKRISSIELHVKDLKNITGLNSEALQCKALSVFCENTIDLDDLNKCYNIEALTLSAPAITNYNGLSKLSKLNTLHIFTESETGLDSFEYNNSITNLKISCKQLTDLSFLTKLKKLSSLDVSGCNITDVSILNQLNSLDSINLSDNNISVINSIGDINQIYLSGNPIDLNQTIAAFIGLDKDKNLTFEEGTYHKLTFPKCDIINTEAIKLKTNDYDKVRISDRIEFLRNGSATIHVFYEDEPVFDYNINITEKTDGSYFYMIKGDVDNNNIVNASDALNLLKISAKIMDMDSTFSIRKNDFDNNYIINAEDALHILETAAKLKSIQTLDDPENFFDEVEYKNGYPTADFISKNLSSGYYFNQEHGMLNILDRGGGFYKVENGEYSGLLSVLYRETDFNKVYWQLRWLIEDAVSNNQLESLDINCYDFRLEIENNKNLNAYWCETRALSGINVHGHKLGFYITDSNELYIYHEERVDFFEEATRTMVYKYTGELPDVLTYESIGEVYSSILELYNSNNNNN